jgi:polysaccharide pyruvyl transferase
MARIGIVSRVHGINYGANLQAFALQKILERLGNDVEYINLEVKNTNKGLRSILSFGYNCVKYLFGYRKRLKRTLIFRKLINFSKEVHTQEDLKELDDRYDVTLCGSDQIWNPRYYTKSNGLYLLNFSKKRKASYASSFGVETLHKEYSEILQSELSTFNSLSSRENTGVAILERMGLKSERHIDPTFLLSSNEWIKFANRRRVIKDPYICCYIMPGVKGLNNYIIKTAERLLANHPEIKKIIIIGEREYKKLFSFHNYITTAGPLEFLSLISNASIVLTSSFHGTCFSIIFNKLFYSILDRSNKFNSRIIDLLSMFNLDNRIRWSDEAFKITEIAPIQYQAINDKIGWERERALQYLSSITK